MTVSSPTSIPTTPTTVSFSSNTGVTALKIVFPVLAAT